MKEIELLKIIFKDSPDILEPLNQIDKEIERLNNIINKAIEYIEEHQTKEYWADEEQLDYVDIYLDEGEIIKVIKILKGSEKE